MKRIPILSFGLLVILISTQGSAEPQRESPLSQTPQLACLGGYGFTPIGDEKAYRSGSNFGNDRDLMVYTDRYSLEASLDSTAGDTSLARKSSFHLANLGKISRYDFPETKSFGEKFLGRPHSTERAETHRIYASAYFWISRCPHTYQKRWNGRRSNPYCQI